MISRLHDSQPSISRTMPETGKAAFTQRFTARVAQVKALHPHALHVVLSEGARWNWQLIKAHYLLAICTLDFWHAAQHLAQAADALFGAPPNTANAAWFERWKTTLCDQPDGVTGVLRTLPY